ncbi:MAG: hypothetical protein ACK45Y_02385 [Betaproteobacteria bacterium]
MKPADELMIRVGIRYTNRGLANVRIPVEQRSDGTLRMMDEFNPYTAMYRKRQFYGWVAGSDWKTVPRLIEHSTGFVDRWADVRPGEFVDLVIDLRWHTPLLCELRGADARLEFYASDESQKRSTLVETDVLLIPRGGDEVESICARQRK